ncbi:unnamed protein product [Acanthosepion pharaonis]|uniref:CCHC-type domain-containing protein n=1 Tax=Acanthosepion pharaonis TaxID=158019 RepID=A0A812AUX3_ACAPH|nr:unnamed protein product [Sepia pharaonis]
MEMEEKDQRDVDQIEARLKEAFTDDTFSAYRKLTMVRWTGECVDVYANNIRQLVGLAGFEGAEMERLTKLAFVEALTVGELLARTRVPITIGDESQDVVTAVRPPRSNDASPIKGGPITSVTCFRCNSKGHIAKDCCKRRTHCRTHCYRCVEVGHWARDCSGNRGQGISAHHFPKSICKYSVPCDKHTCRWYLVFGAD